MRFWRIKLFTGNEEWQPLNPQFSKFCPNKWITDRRKVSRGGKNIYYFTGFLPQPPPPPPPWYISFVLLTHVVLWQLETGNMHGNINFISMSIFKIFIFKIYTVWNAPTRFAEQTSASLKQLFWFSFKLIYPKKHIIWASLKISTM